MSMFDLKIVECPYLPEGVIVLDDGKSWHVVYADGTVVKIDKPVMRLDLRGKE